MYPFYYGTSDFKWDHRNPTYEQYRKDLDDNWGYIVRENLAPVWIGETGTGHDASGVGSAWKDYTLRYLSELDLDFAYWPLGDGRPELTADSEFSVGSDYYSLLSADYSRVSFQPLYDSLSTLLSPRIGPGVLTNGFFGPLLKFFCIL